MTIETLSESRSFGGMQGVYRHASDATGTDMTFAVYLPPAAKAGPVPVLWYLSGLTCTHENAMTKSGAQEHAAREGIALIFPDTSPRGPGVADDPSYDMGQGAGFYVDATEAPWAPHFRMWDYVTRDLAETVFAHFPLRRDAQGMTGHSMGGHGALTIGMAMPEVYRSLSALAPVANPTASDWGSRQLAAYLGTDKAAWMRHDATVQMREKGYPGEVLIDQGTGDQFADLLRPAALAEAMAARSQPGAFRMQEGYDHSYFFVQSFMGDHVRWHAERLRRP